MLRQLKRSGLCEPHGEEWRRVVIEKPFGHDLESADRAELAGQRGVPVGERLPHRPLPGQGDGPEPAGAAVREPAVRADLEQQLRRPRADHPGRGHRRRRPGRLLRRHRRRPRRHPEPPAAADGADRDGGAASRSTRTTCAREKVKVLSAVQLPKDLGQGTARGQYAGGWQGGSEGARATWRRTASRRRLHHRDLRGHQAPRREPALGRGPVLPAHRQAARQAGLRDRGGVQTRAAPAVLAHRHRGARLATCSSSGCSRTRA